jgi:hypothetical protein
VWLTGDAAQDTLTLVDQANLAGYLDGGGKLVLSGQNIGQDIGISAFYGDYLHAAFIDDDTGITQLVGDDIMSGIDTGLSGSDGAGNQDSPSQIGLLDAAVGLFRYDTEPLAWAGLRWEGEYQVVYFAFGLEGLGQSGAAAFRFKIMKNLFTWFGELPCPGDLDGDGGADQADLGVLLGDWGCTFDCVGDLDGDDDTDQADLGVLLSDWGCGG